MAAKSRVFFIMQYEKHPDTGEVLLTEEKIRMALLSHKTIGRWAYICHDEDTYSAQDQEADASHIMGEKKPRHWHVILELKSNQLEVGVIAKWFGIPANFVNITKGHGALLDCCKYLTHEDEKQQELKKQRYDDERVVSNFPWREALTEREEKKLLYGRDLDPLSSMMYDVRYSGKSLRECKEADKILFMHNERKLNELRANWLMDSTPPLYRLNLLVDGSGGGGKTQICKGIARSFYPGLPDDEVFFIIGGDKVTFDGYDGQPVIIWDDCAAINMLDAVGGQDTLFKVLDPFPGADRVRVTVKHGKTQLINCINLINSAQPFADFMRDITTPPKKKHRRQEAGKEDPRQTGRRIPLIICVHAEDYDILLNRGVLQDDARFYTEYFVHKRVRGSMMRLHTLCGGNPELVAGVQQQLVAPVHCVGEELREKYKTAREVSEDAMAELQTYGGTIDVDTTPGVIDFTKEQPAATAADGEGISVADADACEELPFPEA